MICLEGIEQVLRTNEKAAKFLREKEEGRTPNPKPYPKVRSIFFNTFLIQNAHSTEKGGFYPN